MKRSMLLGWLVFAGCIANEEEVATTEQELGAWGSFVLSCGTGTWCETNIGTSIGRTCFLGGISGPISTSTSGEGMGVFREGDRYMLRITNNARHATVIAICISGATDRVEARWRLGDGPTSIPAGSPHRRCFLSNLATDMGFYVSPQLPDTTANYVAIYKHPGHGTWQLRGDLEQPADSYGRATAVCVDVPELVATTFATATETETGTKTGLLVDDTTAACGLTHVGGQFQLHVSLEDRTDQHFDGMQAFLSSRNEWRWAITNKKGYTKTAGFACVR